MGYLVNDADTSLTADFLKVSESLDGVLASLRATFFAAQGLATEKPARSAGQLGFMVDVASTCRTTILKT